MKQYNNIEKIYLLLSLFMIISLTMPLNINSLAVYMFSVFSIYRLLVVKEISIKNGFVILCFSFFMAHYIHYFTDLNLQKSFAEILRKASFVFLPVLIINFPLKNKELILEKVFLFYSYIMSVIGLLFVFIAKYRFSLNLDSNVFFYHEFVSYLPSSAIYYSLLFIISLIIIIENYIIKQSKFLLFLIVLNIAIVLLLSSKTFVFILFLVLVINIFRFKKLTIVFIPILIFFIILPFTFNAKNISKRFKEIKIENILSFKNEITPDTTFDGFSLRKELLKMGFEINRNKFIYGVGIGDAQDLLNEKIVSRGFYIGNDNTEDNGFLNYNFHNQYMQTYVETGFVGLSILLLMFAYVFTISFKTKNSYLFFFNLVFLIAFFTESFLSRLIGIVTFITFNSLLLSVLNSDLSFVLKRIFDIVFSLLVMVLILSWLLPILSLIIILETKSFPIFTQYRTGLNSKPFICYKLRTMKVNNDEHRLPAQENDNRITKFGYFLRKYAFDELLQFINVLKGDMSIVGPRPLMLSEVENFNSKIIDFNKRHIVKPGVTGLAQCNGYKGIVNNISDIRIRYKLDMLYIKEHSLWVDIKIILRTTIYIIFQK